MNTLTRLTMKTLGLGYRAAASVLPDMYLPYPTHGGRIYLNVRESPTMLLRVLGLYERGKVRAVKALLRPGDSFVDVGVNKGDFTLLAARRVGPAGKVRSFEPEPSNCRWTLKSVARNGYVNVTLHEMALSAEDGTATLYLGKKSGWHTLLPGRHNRDAGQRTVLTRRLDSVLAAPEDRVDMIKIDVEGAELAVLEGAERTLTRNEGILVLLDVHPQLGADPLAVRDLLTRWGFGLFEMKAPYTRPATIHADTREILAYRPHGSRG